MPLDEIFEISATQLYQIDIPLLRKESFIQLMKIGTKEVEFSFNNIMFCQTDGVAMGSPLEPILANILMGYIEYIIILKFKTTYPNTSYFRYVYNCFVLTANEEENFLLFEELHTSHKSINLECVENNQLAFLDFLVEKRETNS